jgi:microcystin-dependent protein
VSQPYVGQILLVAFNFAPAGWQACDGSLLPISEFDTLFALIGTTYGGDGQSTFGVPDLRGRVTVHQGQAPGLNSYVIGQLGGVEIVTLTGNQMPQHSHALLASSADATVNDPTNAVLAGGGQNRLYSNATPVNSMNPAMVSPMGGSQPHNNQQPFLVCNWIISQFGVFPSQN